MSREPSVPVAVGATLLAAVVWGTSFVVNDLGLDHVGPATFAMLRFALAGVVVLAGVALLRRLTASPLRSGWFWGLAFANAVGFLLQYLAQTHTTPARTALFVNSSAFAVAAMERYLLGIRIGWKRVVVIAVGVAGAGILLVGVDVADLWTPRLLGDALAAGSGLAWAVYFVMNRRAIQEHEPASLMAWTYAATGLFLVPAVFFDPAPLVVPREAAWAIVYAALATTALAYGLWAFGLRRLRASASAVLLLVEILVAALLSVAIGLERIGPYDLVGAALLAGAVVAMSLLESEPQTMAAK